MRGQRRFLPGVDGLELRLPLDATVAVGPPPEADSMAMDGVLGTDAPPVDYDALLAAIEPTRGPLPRPLDGAFD